MKVIDPQPSYTRTMSTLVTPMREGRAGAPVLSEPLSVCYNEKIVHRRLKQ